MIQAYKADYKKGAPGDPPRQKVQARGSKKVIEAVKKRSRRDPRSGAWW